MSDCGDDDSQDASTVAEEWRSLEPSDLTDLDMSEVPDEALPTDERCPKCHWPVFQVTMTGPSTQVLGPCGCRVESNF